MSNYIDTQRPFLNALEEAEDFQQGFIAGLGVDPATAKMVADCASDPQCTDSALKIADHVWSKAVAIRDAIGAGASSVWGQITGDSRDARRKRRKQEAMVRGVHYRNTFGPLYNQCFGVSDWFQNTRHPPKGDPRKADPLACCALIDVYRRAFTAPESKWLGKISGYSIRMENNFRAEHLVNPHLYMDPQYGGSSGYAVNDSDRYKVNPICFAEKNPDGSFCLSFDRKGFGCGAPDKRPMCRDSNDEKAALVRNHCRPRPKRKPATKTSSRRSTVTRSFKSTAAAPKEEEFDLLFWGGIGAASVAVVGLGYFLSKKKGKR